MAVLPGPATVGCGVVDTSEDMKENTQGSAQDELWIELKAQPGDVFVVPAGVVHETYNALPAANLQRLTPGDGHQDVTRYFLGQRS